MRVLKYVPLAVGAILLLLGIDHVTSLRDEERLAEALGGTARQYLARRAFPALFHSNDFPWNYFKAQFRKGATTKDEVEQMVKGYATKKEFRFLDGVDMEYYFEVGLFGKKGMLLGFDERNIYQGMDVP
jgi:hypothetical protein